jgi:hypothetical protein
MQGRRHISDLYIRINLSPPRISRQVDPSQVLDARTAQLRNEQIMETIADCEHRLKRGIEALEAKKACHQPRCTSFSESDTQRRQLRTYYVTLAFATTAKLLLSLAKSAASSSKHHAVEDVHTLVDQIVAILTQAAEIMSLRGLVWPICMSGSLAYAAQQEQISSIMEVVVSSGDTSFGNCGSIMDVLAHCWRNEMGDHGKPWRAAMAVSAGDLSQTDHGSNAICFSNISTPDDSFSVK